MKVVYHPEFPRDVLRFAAKYADISPALGVRFRREVDAALAAVIAHPAGAGHFIHTGSLILREVRRRNLDIFPFFVLYGLADDRLLFGSVIPSASDPLTWLSRFK
ncbi:MAG: hypothetical protein HY302_03440 [Opitutae bacterium]|nr:hypothetical protein [Opitutae bacterium]